ncbi:receptor-like protein kinase 1 [Actinidia rufa]|uniref:Receptor-like protein kinase 1 n=1 Tax=Actinidia rufa TaxID=165716 RepID=A0A7J0HCA5_9ERIC|nr:receptor-like protein kinase 1 [Actinidia rufa]
MEAPIRGKRDQIWNGDAERKQHWTTAAAAAFACSQAYHGNNLCVVIRAKLRFEMFYKFLFLKFQGSDIIRDGSRNLLWRLAIAQTYSNITLGSSLTANGKNSSWVSPSGDFAFGFQQIGTGGYLLAIWFNNIPGKTIVWSANGDSLAQEGSKIELKTDGSFVLSDPKGQQMWDPSLLGTSVAYAAMLDNGNFVLERNNSSLTLWQSFDHPTDTILPTQVMNQGTTLNAHFTETNYSRGRFVFTLQNDGNLVLYTTKFPLDSVNFAYTASMTIGTGFQVIFNQSWLYIPHCKERNCHLFSIFKFGRWPMEWSVLSFIPSNICLRITQETGGGACGFNSYCIIGSDQRPRCQCPSDWPLSDYEYYQPVTEDWCRDVCLHDCFCAVAIFRNGNCWKKKNPLSNGRIDPSVGGKALKQQCENEVILADWAYDCYKEGKLSLSFENDEEALCDMNRVEKFVMIAIWCIQEDPSLRPTMKKVTQMLEGAVEVSAPPDPSSFISSI